MNDNRQNGGRARGDRFHGRVIDGSKPCSQGGCGEPGEFRAPVDRFHRAADGPPAWQWLCLEHVRAFNSGYNYFDGMSTDEIEAEQRPFAGWERETRAFSANPAGTPRWADFVDPLDAIGAKFAQRAADSAERKDGRPLSAGDRKALKVMGLEIDADRRALRQRYADLVRRYHPDRNGGDRAHEAMLQRVVEAYQQLKGAVAFG